MKDASTGIGLEAAAVKVDAFRAATGVLTAVVAGVLGWLLGLWPPHEDEALALFVGRGSLGDVLHTVVAERGGAPLHFLLAWAVVHLGGGLTALRLVSLVFAVAAASKPGVQGYAREGAVMLFLGEHDSVECVDQQQHPLLDVIAGEVRQQSLDRHRVGDL